MHTYIQAGRQAGRQADRHEYIQQETYKFLIEF